MLAPLAHTRAAAAIAVSLLAAAAHAQWTVSVLHPPIGEASRAMGVRGGHQAGWVTMDGSQGHGRHASIWSGSAGTWIDLNPAVATGGSRIYGTDGATQVGLIFAEGQHRAGMWSGTADSYVSLHPQEAEWSVAYGVSGGTQAGCIRLADWLPRAVMWSGSADSWVDLAPAGAMGSYAYAADGDSQVGHAIVGGMQSASLWRGSAASWVNLNPAASTWSDAWGVHGDAQVGTVFIDDVLRASLWRGSKESWVDLHPAGADFSMGFGVFGEYQIGYASFGDFHRAGLWHGTADSWIDLHAFLPADFANSQATAVWNDGPFIHVAGWGHNLVTGRDEALLWSIPAPASLALLALSSLIGPVRRRRPA